MDRNIVRALTAFTSASSRSVESHSHTTVVKMLAELWPCSCWLCYHSCHQTERICMPWSLALEESKRLWILRGAHVASGWLSSDGGLSWSLTRQQTQSCRAGECSEMLCAIRLVELLQLFCAPRMVVVLNASAIKRLCCGLCSLAFALASSSLFVWINAFPGVDCGGMCGLVCVCVHLDLWVYFGHSCEQALLVGAALAQTCLCQNNVLFLLGHAGHYCGLFKVLEWNYSHISLQAETGLNLPQSCI